MPQLHLLWRMLKASSEVIHGKFQLIQAQGKQLVCCKCFRNVSLHDGLCDSHLCQDWHVSNRIWQSYWHLTQGEVIKDPGLTPLAPGKPGFEWRGTHGEEPKPTTSSMWGSLEVILQHQSDLYRVCSSSQQLDCKLLKDPELEPATWPTSGFLISETVSDHKCFLLYIAKFGDNLLGSST